MQLDGLQDTTPDDLLQTWIQLTWALVSAKHAIHLRSINEDQTQDHVEYSWTASLFGADSDESTREIQRIVMLGCCSSLVTPESLTTAANKP